MANVSAIKLPSGTTYNIKDNGALQLTGGQVTGPVTFGDSVSIDEATLGDLVVNGSASFTNGIRAANYSGGQPVYYVNGTQTASTGSWTGVIDAPALYDGMVIFYHLPYAGSGNATLNLTLSTGATTGAVNCYYSASRLTTHYGAGTTIRMVYHSAGSISVSGTATTDNRWVADPYYDTNTVDRLRDSYFRPYAGEAVYRYKFVMQGADNRMYPITVTNQEDATQVAKVPTQVGLRPGRIWFYNTTTTVAAGSLFASYTLDEAYQTTAGAYNFNTSATAYRMIYLRGTYNKTTDLFTLYKDSSSPCTSYYTYVPTNTANITLSSYFTSGYYYMLLGGTNSTDGSISLFPYNPLYYFDGTNLIPVSTKVAQDTNTDEKVTQTPTSTLDNANYELLLSGTADDTTRTEGVKKTGGIIFNPSTRVLNINGFLYSHNSQSDGEIQSNIIQETAKVRLSVLDERDQDEETSSSIELLEGIQLTNKSDIYDEDDDRYIVNNTITAKDYFSINSSYKVNSNAAITTQLLMEEGRFDINRNNVLYIRINSSGLTLRNLISPTNNTDAATKKYVDDNKGVTQITTTAGAHTVITSSTGAVSFNVPTTAAHVGAASSDHVHGNITNGGDITATAPTIASGDQIIINDHSASKITNGPTFDGSTTTTALTPKGTWESFAKSDTNTTYALSGALSSHKFTSTLTAGGSGSGTSTSDFTLAAGTGITITDDTSARKMTITCDVVNTDEKVKVTDTTATTLYLVGHTDYGVTTSELAKCMTAFLWSSSNTATSGLTRLTLGNSTATTTAGGKEGIVRLYGTDTKYVEIVAGAITSSHKTITLPNKTGTVALTSDLTDEKVSTAALTSGTLYYPILATGTGTATRQIDSTLVGLTYKSTAGTTSTVGTAQLTLGNNKASGTANNEQGQLIFYGKGDKKVTIFADTPNEDVEITLPSITGTLATRDLASIYDRGLMSSGDKIKLDGISVNAAAVKIVRW